MDGSSMSLNSLSIAAGPTTANSSLLGKTVVSTLIYMYSFIKAGKMSMNKKQQ